MTIAEKILARASGREKVVPGEIVTCKVDLVCVDEIQMLLFLKTLQKMGTDAVDGKRTVFVLDHYSPPNSLDQANANQMVRQFALSHGLVPLEGGIKPQLLMENGLIRPGMLLVATDSHINTCGALGAFAAAIGPAEAAMMAVLGESWFRVPETIRCEIAGCLSPMVTPKDIGLHILEQRGVSVALYKAIEFTGPMVRELCLDGRITLCNMSTEMGAKTAMVGVDGITEDFLRRRHVDGYPRLESDPDATYEETLFVDASELEPLVAAPHSPGNVKRLSQVGDVRIDQAFIGSCGNGGMDDLRIAARILKGRTVHHGTRLIVTPASREVYIRAMTEGLIEIFLHAGATVSGTTCSVCPGFEGVLAPKEVCITTSPRNFIGRMGSPEALIYLGSPATVAASAVRGKIADPMEFL